jgi:hypothetical protein
MHSWCSAVTVKIIGEGGRGRGEGRGRGGGEGGRGGRGGGTGERGGMCYTHLSISTSSFSVFSRAGQKEHSAIHQPING